MKFYELFSKRQKRKRGRIPDVYQCEAIPEKLRVQVVHIWRDVWGEAENDNWGFSGRAYEAFSHIHNYLSREYGIFTLGKEGEPFEKVINFLLNTKEIETVIDVIEFSVRCFDPEISDDNNRHFYSNVPPDAAINELNKRFREHGVGYQYESGLIIQVDSQFVHNEVVKPAFRVLSNPIYKGANEEFLSAHAHYRKHKYKECLNDCLKAFESCLKGICKKRGWHYDENRANAKYLIQIVFDNELIPTYLQSHFSALKSTLESGLPTVRNREAGHGQGPEKTDVSESLAAYALHLTASNIHFLAKADEELK
ncbi:MAG: hypothetical protein OXI43_05895 [Candidatus Poribacteria bacterium]|nr:hypothetical protein [Candidatus Poribacteria bacterium]